MNEQLIMGNYCSSLFWEAGLFNPQSNIDKKEISSKYQDLPIKNRKELDINGTDISEIMNKKPGSYINEIMNDIEYNVLYKKLKNNKEDIKVNYFLKNLCYARYLFTVMNK